MSKLTAQDTDRINLWARYYARDGDISAFNSVLEYLDIATPDEAATVRFWWHEGCRDYARDMGHLDELMQGMFPSGP